MVFISSFLDIFFLSVNSENPGVIPFQRQLLSASAQRHWLGYLGNDVFGVGLCILRASKKHRNGPKGKPWKGAASGAAPPYNPSSPMPEFLGSFVFSGMTLVLYFPSTLNLESLLKPLLFHRPFPYRCQPF